MIPPPVAIVIPVKNRATLLAETLRSLEAQSATDWEAILVDDGSSPSRLERIRGLVANDPRMRLLERGRAPAGASVCRNVGLEATGSPLVVFLDSDDVLDPDAVETRLREIGERPEVGFLVHQTEVFREAPGDVGVLWNEFDDSDDLERFLHLDTPWQTSGPTWRREAVRRIGGYDEQAVCWQDWEIHVRALAHRVPYAKVRHRDHHHRIGHPDSARARHGDIRCVRSLERMFERVKDVLERTGQLTAERLRCLLGYYLRIAQHGAARSRNSADAYEILETAARLGLLDPARVELARTTCDLAARGEEVAVERLNEASFPERILARSKPARLRARTAPSRTSPEILRTLRWGERDQLRTALSDHPVVRLCARGLDPAELIDLARSLGEPVPHHRSDFRLQGHPEISLVGNYVGPDGSKAGSAVGRGWHVDSSFLETPNTFTMLFAVDVPKTGGETWFTSLARLHRELDPATRERWKALQVRHVYRSGDPNLDRGRMAVHPLIAEHEESGQRLVYASPGFAERVLELDEADSSALLEELAAALEPPDLEHRWSVGDLLIWDNRLVVHRATPHDPGETRCMYRIALR